MRLFRIALATATAGSAAAGMLTVSALDLSDPPRADSTIGEGRAPAVQATSTAVGFDVRIPSAPRGFSVQNLEVIEGPAEGGSSKKVSILLAANAADITRADKPSVEVIELGFRLIHPADDATERVSEGQIGASTQFEAFRATRPGQAVYTLRDANRTFIVIIRNVQMIATQDVETMLLSLFP